MAYLGAGLDAVNETLSTINMVCDTMTGNGVLTTKVLGSPTAPGSVNNVSVYYDGVAQTPTTDYTLSGSTITFSEAPASNVNVVILSYADEFSKTISDNTVYTDVIEDSAITNNKILGISASKLTGALPALDGSALTGVSAIDPVLINETSNPTVSSMTATGNGVGTIWVNSTTGAMFICTDATVGANVWTNVGEGSGNVVPAVLPTGGTITTDGNFKVHTFTGSSQFVISDLDAVIGNTVEYLVVAGGGGGGANSHGAGGGAGGYLTTSNFSVTSQAYTITVGAGGNGGTAPGGPGNVGENSVFSTITALGGGFGGRGATGGNGGSGGGGSWTFAAGLGTAGQGNNGSSGKSSAPNYPGGGGGGAGAVGGASTSTVAGAGGAGVSNDIKITGTNVFYAGGGGGGSYNGGTIGAGGTGGGGDGATQTDVPSNGDDNFGGGGGGAGGVNVVAGANGGSGVVIIRYRFQ